MIVAGPEGFRKRDYRKFNIRSADLTPGDDFAMMREVLGRRFKRLLAEAPRVSAVADLAASTAAVTDEAALPREEIDTPAIASRRTMSPSRRGPIWY